MPIWLQVLSLILALFSLPTNVACVIFAWRAAVDASDARNQLIEDTIVEVAHHGR